MQASSGFLHTVCVDSDGHVWMFGDIPRSINDRNREINQTVPMKLESVDNVESVSAGFMHTALVHRDGTIRMFGENRTGELGLGHKDRCTLGEITQFPKSVRITSVSCGKYHTICLASDQSCWSFGYNKFGQLGLGHNTDQDIPQQIPDLTNIRAISSRGTFSLFLNIHGEVFAVGRNDRGQLGLDDQTISAINVPQLISNLQPVDAVATGFSGFSLFLIGTDVYSCGNNFNGQLGHGEEIQNVYSPKKIDSLPPIQQISAANIHSMFVDTSGQLWVTGSNTYGQLGQSIDCQEQLIQVPGIDDVETVADGFLNTIVKDRKGKIWAFGCNQNGQLGLNSRNNDIFHPTALSDEYSHIIATKTSRAKSALK